MASFFKQGDFTIDPNTTPEMLRKKRERIAAAMPRYGKAQYIGEGLGQLFQGIGSGRVEQRLDDFESRRNSEEQDNFNAMMNGGGSSGPLSILGMRQPDAPAPKTQTLDEMYPLGRDSSRESTIDPVSGYDMGREVPSQGHDHMQHAGQTHSDWLKYENQGATRNQPLNDKLIQALSFLPELGVEMRVVSGGQAAAGSGGPRTGSTRHDHGNAADADFYKDGRKLDWNNPADVPLFQEIARRAAANGAGGIGAGDDYMGAGRMHIGFGSEAVWGAGGKGANAPAWLRDATGGAAGPQPTRVADAGGPDLAYLMEAAANPWLTPEQRSVVGNMISQKQSQQAAADERYWRDQDPLRQIQIAQGQLNLDQDRAGVLPPSSSVGGLQAQAREAGLVPGTPEYQQFMLNGGGDPATYRALKMQAIDAGHKPGTAGYQRFMETRGAGASAYDAQSNKNLAEADTGAAAAAAGKLGEAGVEVGMSSWEAYGKLQTSLGNIDEAIAAIDSGAKSGMIYNMLPSVTQASASLENAMQRMGLDVIGAVTFGALSEGEMKLAMSTAAPQKLSPPDLRAWLVRRRDAQAKAATMVADAAEFLTTGGSIGDWVKRNKAAKGASQTTQTPTAQNRLKFNPATGKLE